MKPVSSRPEVTAANAHLVEPFRDAMVAAARHATIEPSGPNGAERGASATPEHRGAGGVVERVGVGVSERNGHGVSERNGNGVVERNGHDVPERNGHDSSDHGGSGVIERNGHDSSDHSGSAVIERNGHVVIERNGSQQPARERTDDEQADSERRRHGDGSRGRRGSISSVRISVVIPALNEALNLRHVLANLPDNVFEVVLVPGTSTDDTETVARRLRPDVRVVHQTRSGKGNALACGFAAWGGDIIVTLDADGSADPKEIPAFVGALLAGADFAKGTRAIQGGGSHDMTVLRRLGNRGLTHLANVLHGTHYSDLCYGYNAFWLACLPALNVDIDGFEVETLLNLRAAKSGLRVAEVASFELARIHGNSNLRTFRDGWRVLGTILREWVPKHHRIAHTPPSRLEAGRRRGARRADRTAPDVTPR
jgi:hypothetical protein